MEVLEENVQREFTNFKNQIRQKFSHIDFKNMEKNLKDFEIIVTEDKLPIPGVYETYLNVIFIKKDLEEYKFTEDDLNHMIHHESVHMSSSRNPKFLIHKTGFQKGSGMLIKNIAINEGITDYIAEETNGKANDNAYVFEKRCAKSLRMIFGDELLQSFFDASLKDFYKHAMSVGITRGEINNLFSDMDKSLLWRNKCVYRLNNKKEISNKKNKYVCKIEKNLIDMAVKVALNQGLNKDEICKRIADIEENFIPQGLEFSMENKKEIEFLSEYSEGLEEAFSYSEKMKEDIANGKITSADQITTKRGLFRRKKEEVLALPSGTRTEYTIDTENSFKEGLKVKQDPHEYIKNMENSSKEGQAIKEDNNQVVKGDTEEDTEIE